MFFCNKSNEEASSAILKLVMKNQLHAAIDYIVEHKQLLGTLAIGLVGVIVLVGLFIYNQPHGPKVVYQPTKACDILTPGKAMDVLGDKVNNVEANKPVISGNVATSKCAYTDQKTDKDLQAQTSILILSAINDEGIPQVKTDFIKLQKQAQHVQTVSDLGTSAYFDQDSNILYIQRDKQLIMLYYGVGQDGQSKPFTDVIAFAHNILK